MLAMKQAAYYINTATPYFALSLSFVVVRNLDLIKKLSTSRIFVVVSFAVLISGLSITYLIKDNYNRRDRVLLQDFDVLERQLESLRGTAIGAITKSRHDSSYGYLMRMYSISLDTLQPFHYPIVFSNKDSIENDSLKYIPQQEETKMFRLFFKNP